MTVTRLARIGRWWVVLAVICHLSVGLCRGGEVDVILDSPEAAFEVANPGPAVVPTVYLVGRPDRKTQPVRKTKGLTLNGVRLTETLLSESVLILYPDGSGKWGYHTGFDIFREPHYQSGKRVDPRSLVEYDKWKYDPLEPVRCVGGDMNLLQLHAARSLPAAFYEVAFADPIRIRSIQVRSNCDQLSVEGVIVRVRLFADRGRKTLIAEQSVGHGQEHPRFPVAFDGLDHGRVYVELSAEAPRAMTVGLYWTFFEATLDARQVRLPALGAGDNRWTLTDDSDSSHQGRLVLRWVDRPAADRVWDDFEGKLQWSGCKPVASSQDEGLSFTGQQFVRATFPANGRDYGLNRSLPEIDLSHFNRLGIAMRVQQGSPMRAILVGIKNANSSGYQYVRLSPKTRWTFQSFDISRFRRDRVVAMNIYWLATPGIDWPEKPCVYDVDTLALWQEDSDPVEQAELPPKIANYQSRFSQAAPPDRPIPPLQEWFPLGFYDGTASRSDKECEWLFDQMKRLSMNTVYLSNGSLEGLERLLPMAEARGIRLVYQGGSDGALYYLHLATAEARRHSLERVILPKAREWVPRFRDRFGLLAWSLTEEIAPELSRELPPFYELVRELDPSHPPTVLHNNLSAATADLETSGPLVITHDFYPFFWSPQSGPSNPHRSIAMYRSRIGAYYRVCRKHGASLWMMPQAWGSDETAPLDPPHYGYRRGMRTPEPGEIKLQGWVAIAEGATGLMFYATVARDPGQHHLWDAGWTETANTRAAGILFARVGRVAPLLCRLERDGRESGFVKISSDRVLAHSFAKRPGNAGDGRYIVLASLDGFGPQTVGVTLTGAEHVYDMVNRRDVTGQLTNWTLAPGEGTLLLAGTARQYEADCHLIDKALSGGKP